MTPSIRPERFRRGMAVLALTAAIVGIGAGAPVVSTQDRLTPIQYGQQVQGELAAGDEQLADDSYVDEYVFRGRRGERITVTLRSTAFDTYLTLGDYPDNRNWREVAKDDDGAGGTDSRVTLTLPADGRYILRANSVEPNRQGRYTLQLFATGTGAPRPATESLPTDRRGPSAQVTPGRYFCTGYGLTSGGTRGFVPKGSFVLEAGGRYTANSTRGRFRVTGGEIRFTGGAYDGITGELRPLDGTPRYVLTWPGAQEGRPSTQYCLLTARS